MTSKNADGGKRFLLMLSNGVEVSGLCGAGQTYRNSDVIQQRK